MNEQSSENLWRECERKISELSEIVSLYDQIDTMAPSSSLDRFDSRTLEALSEIDHEIKTVDAILKIAAAHTRRQAAHDKTSEYDKAKLLALQVQIDPNSQDDATAAALFYEAQAQLNWLQHQKAAHQEALKAQQESFLQSETTEQRRREERKEKLLRRYVNVAEDEVFSRLINKCRAFEEDDAWGDEILLGFTGSELPLPHREPTALAKLRQALSARISPCSPTVIRIPVAIEIANGAALYIEDEDPASCRDLSTVGGFLLRLLCKLDQTEELGHVSIVEPTSFSPLYLGEVGELCYGEAPLVDTFPRTQEEIRSVFRSISDETRRLDELILSNKSVHLPSNVFVFCDYPQAYDSFALSIIQKLIVLRRRYKAIVILCASQRELSKPQDEAVAAISKHCLAIQKRKCAREITLDQNGGTFFEWTPLRLDPRDAITGLTRSLSKNRLTDNSYINRINCGIESHPVKGDRALSNLPIGIDDKGEIVSIDFENENFAAFICGASRSGKSTLLHSLLTSIFLSKHPDDVEIWLVDFKMTEFSRYTVNTPPHIRYIVLDESPELVYDLIDRLTEVLRKRQSIFKKNGWVKLSDAQNANKYMPALLVTIDEFSVMSKIIADAALEGKDYRDKFQMLLSKGAAFGFRFVLSSQGFTQGTRGLSDYSKKQIQQRIAMKTELTEIKETLGLPSPTDAEKSMMEELVPHYALLKRNTPAKGGRIRSTHVLYFEDAADQASFLSSRMTHYDKGAKYDIASSCEYIDKELQIFDGNELTEYSHVHQDILSHISRKHGSSCDSTTQFLCIGQPLRMKRSMVIELVDGYAESILLSVPTQRSEAFQSVLATMTFALENQRMQVKAIIPRSTPLISKSFVNSLPISQAFYGREGLKEFAAQETRTPPDEQRSELIIVFNPETIFEQSQTRETSRANDLFASRGDSREKSRQEREPDDLLTRIKKNELNVDIEALKKSAESTPADENIGYMQTLRRLGTKHRTLGANDTSLGHLNPSSLLIDMMERAPQCGCHFMLVTQNVSELRKLGISQNWFKHRIAFRMAVEDARSIMNRRDSAVVAELPENCFRYSNGIDGTTFRPYSHQRFELLVNAESSDQEEYLL